MTGKVLDFDTVVLLNHHLHTKKPKVILLIALGHVLL